MSDVIPTIEVMPITTPSTVKAERILLVRRVSIDIVTISLRRPALRVAILLYSATAAVKIKQEKGRRGDILSFLKSGPVPKGKKYFSLSPLLLFDFDLSSGCR